MGTPLNGSLIKGFEVLKLFSEERPEISASAVVSELGMNLATAHRFLLTLEQVGVLVSFRRGYYRLGSRLEELGQLAEETNSLSHIVKPTIEQVSEGLEESVMACRLGRSGPTCMAVSISSRPLNVHIRVGTVLPLHSTAQGKLWLAEISDQERLARLENYNWDRMSNNTIANPLTMDKELKAIRKQGFAVNRGENEPDLGAVSVPVWNSNDEIILSLSAFGMLSRFDDALIRKAVKQLKKAAKSIQQKLH